MNQNNHNKKIPSVNNDTITIDRSLDQFANHIPALIWASRKDGLCNYFNATWLDFVGRDIEQELGNGWAENVHPDDLGDCLKIYGNAVRTQSNFTLEYRLKRHDGEYRWILDKGVARFDEAGEFIGFIGTCLDVTEHHRALEVIEKQRDQLARIAITDELTNLFNRRYFIHHAKLEIQRHRRYGHPLHLMMIDIDDFKIINDTQGHNEGDELLRNFADIFKRCIRSIDVVCRIGGDEFCIIVPEADTQGVVLIAERILIETDKLSVPKSGNQKITISIGISAFDNDIGDVNSWLKQADIALYHAKSQGKNKIAVG
ncbi:MAG: sensor domain-containing diguanylate cyclase [Gammaproteobacteria bacterium]